MKYPKPSFTHAFLWFVISTALLCLPGSAIPSSNWFSIIELDKWVHLFLFGVLVILWCYAVSAVTSDRKKLRYFFLLITFISVVYAVIMEFVQINFIPNRSYDVADIIAGAAGSFVGLFFARRFVK